MDKTEEILNWYIQCIGTGSICYRTEEYYIKNYPLQYNEAIIRYKKLLMDSRFPRKGTVL